VAHPIQTMFTKIFQINTNFSKLASAELAQRSTEYDLALVQEPYFTRNGDVYLSNDNSKIVIGNKNCRACIFMKKTMSGWKVNKFTSRDMATVLLKQQITMDDGKSRLVNTFYSSVYLDIRIDMEHQKNLQELVQHCEANKIPLVIGCDSNSHSSLWGCQEENRRGRDLEEFIEYNDLTVMNMGSRKTFEAPTGSSIIDITVTNRWFNQIQEISDWHVKEDNSFSDHKYISFKTGSFVPLQRKYRNFYKVDWSKFKNKIGEKMVTLPTEGSLNSKAEEWLQIVKETMDEFVPLKPALKIRPVPWWNEEIAKLRAKIGKILSKVRKSRGGQRLKDALKKKTNEYKKLIRTAKRKSWQSFCSNYENIKDVSKIARSVIPKVTPKIGLIKDHDDIEPTTPEESMKNLIDAHFPNCEILQGNLPGLQGRCMDTYNQTNDQDTFDNIITFEKLKEAISTFDSYKASGPDEISPCVLKHLPDNSLEYLRKLMVHSLRTGAIPKSWTAMRVVFIPKPGKDTYDKPKSYRPITLSSFILKSLERLLQWYIQENHLQQPLPSQHAYTIGMSTDSALSEAVDYIESAVYTREYALAVSLDCSGAFDNITFQSAESALRRKNVREEIIDWYKKLLKNRIIEANINDINMKIIPKKGSPQGGILSPTIWNFIMDDLLTKLQGDPVKAVAYADDLLLIVRGTNPENMCSIMNRQLQKVYDWGQLQGIRFNPSKTQATIFTSKTKKVTWPVLEMNKTQIQYADTMKYLGITLDKKLLWSTHIAEKVKKAKKLLNLMKSVVGRNWGLGPKQALWIYTAIVKPMVTYGSLVWSHNLHTNNIMKLNQIQRLGIISTCHPMRSTPTKGLEILFGLPPMHLEAQRLGTMARIRTKDSCQLTSWYGKKITKYPHAVHHDKLINELFMGLETDDIRRRKIWDCRFLEEPIPGQMKIFTDGSKIGDKNPGGGLCITREDCVLAEYDFSLGEHNTVFQAEVAAIRGALTWIKQNPEASSDGFHIQTDSQSAIQALKKIEVNSKLVLSTKELLKDLDGKTSISISWVKGHSDNTGNEVADMIAKRGATSETKVKIGISKATMKSKTKEYYLTKWKEDWERYPEGRQSKQFMPNAGIYKSSEIVGYSKTTINRLVQFFTGHALLNRHMKIMGHDVSPTCRKCGEAEETPSHLLKDCEAFCLQRKEFLSNHEEGSNCALDNVLRFLESTGIIRWMGGESDEGISLFQ